MKFHTIIRAFAYRNYRLFWGGQAISLIGTWMQRVALGWLVYRLTNSPLMLGLVDFVGQVPAFIFTPFAGVYLDHWNRLRILKITQLLLLLQALLLAVLVLTNRVTIELVILLNIFFGLVNAFDMPARQAFLKDVIERKEDLGNAIALNSSMFNGARLVGPSIAGLVIALFGEGWCFLINAITFLAVLLALFAMRITNFESESIQRNIFKSVSEGFQYAFQAIPIRVILLLLSMVGLVGLPYTVLLPVLAKDIFHGDARTLGFLTGATGVGALFGAYFLASRKSVLGLEKVMLRAVTAASIAFIFISMIHIFWLALFFIVFIGFGFMSVYAAGNTILQTIVDDDKRGRILAFYTMTFQGMTSIGSLIAGTVAKHVGVPTTLFLSGILLILSGVVFSLYLSKLQSSIHLLYGRLHLPKPQRQDLISI